MSLSSVELAALLASPALTPPTGVTANFDNPPNRNGLAWFVTTLCMVIATLCLLLRGYARVWLQRKFDIEEILMLLAYGAYWGTAYAGYSLIYTPGYYVHMWNLHNGDLIRPLYLILVYGCAYSAVLPLLKTAILLSWCRIFVPGNRLKSPFWWGCMAIIVLQCLWGVLCIILLNTQCIPHAAIYLFYLPSKCYDLTKVMLTSASVQVFSDWCMVLLPQKIIWDLRMNWQKKVGISILFGVGILASISASFRLATTITFAEETDTMYYIGPLLFWACGEMTCGFFILCMPCFATVIQDSRPHLWLKKKFGWGMKPDEDDRPNLDTYGHANSRGSSKKFKSGMDKDGVPFSKIGTSESQEYLHNEPGKIHVQINITSSSQSGKSRPEDTILPWDK